MNNPHKPEPFTPERLGVLYCAMEHLIATAASGCSPEERLKLVVVQTQVRDHFIAAGGDPQELED